MLFNDEHERVILWDLPDTGDWYIGSSCCRPAPCGLNSTSQVRSTSGLPRPVALGLSTASWCGPLGARGPRVGLKIDSSASGH